MYPMYQEFKPDNLDTDRGQDVWKAQLDTGMSMRAHNMYGNT